jgi:hypothetical protein
MYFCTSAQLRHTPASGNARIRKIALWLGHATLQSTEIYLRADPTEKLEMLDALAPLGVKPGELQCVLPTGSVSSVVVTTSACQ